MTRRLFAVIRRRAPAFDAARPLEQQQDWRAHADFMNGLAKGGFVVLGGPLAGTDEVLLIVRAADEAAIEARLARDPWSPDRLTVSRIVPWDLRLGTLG